MLATDILRRQYKFNPDRVAATFEGRAFSFREMRERVLRAANALRGLGVKKGDRVAVLAFNCHQYIELYFANGLLGSVTTPLNFRLTPAELEYIINDSEAVALIVGQDLVASIAPIRDRIPRVKHFVCIGDAEGMSDYEQWIAAAPAVEPGETVGENDLLWQMYTSGTTGRPKGAMISHRNLITNVMQCSWEMPVRPGDCALIVAPTYHAAAMITSMNALAGGGSLAIKKTFNPLEVLGAFQNEGVTHALLVPAMIQFMLTIPDIDKVNFGGLRYVIYGASAIPLEVLRKAMHVFRCQFVQGFGQTESTAILTMLRPEDHVLDGPPEVVRRLQSCGREVIGCEVRVVNENGEEVKPGEIGEVIARGANVMQGYWKLPEATASTLQDGWLHTGDLATVDEAGFVYIMDRIKDMIVPAARTSTRARSRRCSSPTRRLPTRR